MDVFVEPLPTNGCLCWFHNSGFQQTCYSIFKNILRSRIHLNGFSVNICKWICYFYVPENFLPPLGKIPREPMVTYWTKLSWLSFMCKGCTIQGLAEGWGGGLPRMPKVLIKVKRASLSLPWRTFCFILFTFFTAHLSLCFSSLSYSCSFSFLRSFQLGNESRDLQGRTRLTNRYSKERWIEWRAI
jgi:hypothetical protein